MLYHQPRFKKRNYERITKPIGKPYEVVYDNKVMDYDFIFNWYCW